MSGHDGALVKVSGEYTRLVRELAVVGIPMCDPPALGKILVELIQRGNRAQMACEAVLDNLCQFKYDKPDEANNPQIATAIEHLKRTRL
jgi:hypothetical protein